MEAGLSQRQALDFQAALDNVNLDTVPVMTTDRGIPRKEQARLLRQLLKQLKVPHVRITTPRYSRASGVDVTLPERQDCPLDIPVTKRPETEAARMNRAAMEKFEQLLLRAFPNHDDRSDPRLDHYKFCWSIDVK